MSRPGARSWWPRPGAGAARPGTGSPTPRPRPPPGSRGPAVRARVAEALGPRDLVVDEALTSGRGLRAVVSRRTPETWLAHRGSALGWGLPAAVGAKLADPRRRVMALQGDGSLLFGVSALWTAAREGLGVALVVADNGGYEILRAGLEGLTGRPEGVWPGIGLMRPRIDLEAICRGYGASAARVAAAGDLPEAMADLWRRTDDGPAVLVVDVGGHAAPVGYPVLTRRRGPDDAVRADARRARPEVLAGELTHHVDRVPAGRGVPEPTSSVGRMRPAAKVPSGFTVVCSTMLVESGPPSENTL